MHETPIADPLAGTAHGLPDSGSVTPNCRKASAEKRRAYFAERYRQARVHLDDGVGLLIQELRAEDA